MNGLSIRKIDDEGSELEVIESFKSEIEKSMPFIIMEILPVYNLDDNPDRYSRQNEIQKILKELGYTTLRIVKNKKQLLNFNEVSEIGIHSNLDECDYIFVPENNLDQFNFISQKVLVD